MPKNTTLHVDVVRLTVWCQANQERIKDQYPCDIADLVEKDLGHRYPDTAVKSVMTGLGITYRRRSVNSETSPEQRLKKLEAFVEILQDRIVAIENRLKPLLS